MSTQIVIAVMAGVALMAIVWWPVSTGNRTMLMLGGMTAVAVARQSSIRVGLVASILVAGIGFAAGLVSIGVLAGAAGAVLAGVCAWAVAVLVRSRRSMREADELAQLTGALANQALVAPTVVEAVRQAAPLVPGRVGAAAQQMATECETSGLMEAATRFAGTIGRPIAEMLATVLAEAFRGGSQWVHLSEVLADEATEAAETARHFHRHVAALMPQLAVTVVMAVGMLAVTGFATSDVGRWFASPTGQQFLLLLALLVALVCARVLVPAWRAGR